MILQHKINKGDIIIDINGDKGSVIDYTIQERTKYITINYRIGYTEGYYYTGLIEDLSKYFKRIGNNSFISDNRFYEGN